MLTNQTMQVDILGELLKVEHKTWMGSLTDLFKIGNSERVKSGGGAVSVSSFLATAETENYIKSSCKAWNIPRDEIVQIRGKGSKRNTWAHLSVLVAAAEYLSSDIHALVVKEFIEGRLLQFRDSSGDSYKELSGLITSKLGNEAVGSQLIMEVATEFRNKINPPGDKGWNLATAVQLRQRDKLEDFLCKSLKMGLLKDKNGLLGAIKNYEF